MLSKKGDIEISLSRGEAMILMRSFKDAIYNYKNRGGSRTKSAR
jgi:hypothetical protein